VVLRDEIEEIAESEIDTLGGLELLRVFEESGLQVFLHGFSRKWFAFRKRV